jgi:hypothetical protein
LRRQQQSGGVFMAARQRMGVGIIGAGNISSQ